MEMESNSEFRAHEDECQQISIGLLFPGWSNCVTFFDQLNKAHKSSNWLNSKGGCHELAPASQTSPPVEIISLLISTIPSSSSPGSSRPSYFLWKKPWEWGKHALNSLVRLSYRRLQLFRKRLSEKVHATIPKGIVGGFDITVLQRNFERMAREAIDYVSEC